MSLSPPISAPTTPPPTLDAFDSAARESPLLRLITCGSVDDGKSTLIGRLLFDSKGVYQDQLDAIQRTSHARGSSALDLALITDGLRAEREQGITIDVAYRYFATPARRFILADTPGHAQYTRNMATGASTADAAIILIDARQGVIEQTRRHTCIAALLGIRHLIVAINKMDLVAFDQAIFDRITADFLALARTAIPSGGPSGGPSIADAAEITCIPISALLGDNVVARSAHTPWYSGPILLDHLEQIPASRDATLNAPRFPVQYVLRPQTADHHDYRGYAGQVAAGQFSVGDDITALPGGQHARISSIHMGQSKRHTCIAGESVSIELTSDLDIARGDILVPTRDLSTPDAPLIATTLDATLVWMSPQPLAPGKRLLLKHTARSVAAVVRALTHRLDINTLAIIPGPPTLALNEIGRATIRLATPIPCDPYTRSRLTGAFILIDEQSNNTVAAGMIVNAHE